MSVEYRALRRTATKAKADYKQANLNLQDKLLLLRVLIKQNREAKASVKVTERFVSDILCGRVDVHVTIRAHYIQQVKSKRSECVKLRRLITDLQVELPKLRDKVSDGWGARKRAVDACYQYRNDVESKKQLKIYSKTGITTVPVSSYLHSC